MARRFEIVLNRGSGGLQDLWHDGLTEEVVTGFRNAGVEAGIRAVFPEEIDDAMERALASSPEALVVGGGDGTVSNAAARLVGSDTALGILPLGTFNLAARDLGLPLELEDAMAALSTARSQAIDVLQIGERMCLCTALAGFYPRMAERQEEFHGRAWWLKSLQIIKDTLCLFHRSKPLALRLEPSDDIPVETTTRFAAFVPGDYDDLFSIIPKRTQLSEGLMTVYLSKHRSLPGVIRASLAYLIGRLKSEKDLQRLQTTSLRLAIKNKDQLLLMIDGEIVRLPLPLNLRIRSQALTVLRPRNHS